VILRSLWTQHKAWSSLTALLMFPCFHHDLYRTLCPWCAFFLLPFFLFFSSFDFVSSYLQKTFFPLSSNERISSAPFFKLLHTTQSGIVFASSSQLFFSCSDRLSHIFTAGPSFSPQKSRSSCAADWKKGRADIAASSSILQVLNWNDRRWCWWRWVLEALVRAAWILLPHRLVYCQLCCVVVPFWCFRDDCTSTVGHAVAVVRSSQSRGKLSSRNHGEEICHDPCHAKFVAIVAGHQLPLTHRALTVPRYEIWRVLNRLFLYSCSKPKHPPVGDHSYTTGNRSRNLCYDSWSLSHLGYLYPGTTPVMIKLYRNRSCPWV